MTTLAQDRAESAEHVQAGQASSELAADRPIIALDRCDSCGAQAYVRAVLGASELLFCGHHAKKHEAKLRPLTQTWHDETSRLTAARW